MRPEEIEEGKDYKLYGPSVLYGWVELLATAGKPSEFTDSRCPEGHPDSWWFYWYSLYPTSFSHDWGIACSCAFYPIDDPDQQEVKHEEKEIQE